MNHMPVPSTRRVSALSSSTKPAQRASSIGSTVPALTPRQAEVLLLLSRGRSQTEAAADLGISLGTLRKHVERAYRNLGVSTLLEALRARGWLQLPEDIIERFAGLPTYTVMRVTNDDDGSTWPVEMIP